MKKYILLSFSLIFFNAFILSCTDDDDRITEYSNYSVTKEILIDYKWAINNIKINNQNYITPFTDFKFTFLPNGEIEATRGILTYNGSYKLYNISESEDNIKDLRLRIDFHYTNDFSLLSKDWSIIRRDDKYIEFHTNENNILQELSILGN